jgi:EpsI family protein
MRPSIRHGLLALAFLGTYGFTHAVAPVVPSVPAAIAELPMTLVPWSGVAAPPLEPEVAEVLAADAYVRRYYYDTVPQGPAGQGAGAPRQAVEMDISYYAQPRIGANMHSPLNCLPGNGWQITKMDTVTLAGGNGARVRALTVERGQHRFAMAYWFQSRDRVVTGEASTRFHLLADALQRRPTDAGVVRVMAPMTGATSAEAAVLAFASRLVPELAKVLRGV